MFSQLLSQAGVDAPTTQSMSVYLVLLVLNGLTLWHRRGVRRAAAATVQPPACEASAALPSAGDPLEAPFDAARASHVSDDPWLELAWWKYALLALVDVEANFVIVTALLSVHHY